MFNIWPEWTGREYVYLKRQEPTWKESRRNYIRTDKFRVCCDHIDYIQTSNNTQTDIRVVLICLKGRKEFLRLEGLDARQFIEAWDNLTS